MISDYFDRILVINLPRALKRRAAMLFQIGRMNLKKTQFIQAVDGQYINLEKMKAEGALLTDDWRKRDLTQGEVGCYLSHVKAWKFMVDQGLGKVLICEDDVVWRDDSHEIADIFMKEIPDDWDIIHFHSYVEIGSGKHYDGRRKKLSEHVWQGYLEGEGSVCYAINRRAAEFLLKEAFPIRYLLDGVINKLTRPSLNLEYRGYVCHPFICGVSNSPSEIDNISKREN